MRTTQSQPILDVFAKVYGGYKQVGYHNQIELTFAIKDTNKESIINDGGNRIATKMAVGK